MTNLKMKNVIKRGYKRGANEALSSVLKLSYFVFTTLLIFAIQLQSPAYSNDKKSAHSHNSHDHHPSSKENLSDGEILSQMNQILIKINTGIANGELASLHNHCESLLVLSEGLRKNVGGPDRFREEGLLNNIEKAIHSVHESADRNDKLASEVSFKKLSGLIKIFNDRFRSRSKEASISPTHDSSHITHYDTDHHAEHPNSSN